VHILGGVNLILSGRGVDLDESLRSYATEKLTRVQRVFDRIIKMEVELRRERNPRVQDPDRVEVTVRTPIQTLRVHGEGIDHYAAIDVAAARLESQARKIKGRLLRRNHDKRPGPSWTQLEAPAAFEESPEADASPRIERITQPATKPLAPEEACLELTTRGLQFLLYTDAESMRPAVVYRRNNGGFGLITHDG
jgi:putative sigma-54 modulation protein